MQQNVVNVCFRETEQNDEAMMHVSVDTQRETKGKGRLKI